MLRHQRFRNLMILFSDYLLNLCYRIRYANWYLSLIKKPRNPHFLWIVTIYITYLHLPNRCEKHCRIIFSIFALLYLTLYLNFSFLFLQFSLFFFFFHIALILNFSANFSIFWWWKGLSTTTTTPWLCSLSCGLIVRLNLFRNDRSLLSLVLFPTHF